MTVLAMHPGDMALVLRMMSTSLGETLRVERYRRGLSIHLVTTECLDLGLDIRATALSSWERQERWPSRENCQALSVWLTYSAGQPTVSKGTVKPRSVVRMVLTTVDYRRELDVDLPSLLVETKVANGGPSTT